MTKLKNNVVKLNDLIKSGKLMEAFEKYYSKDVILQVNGNKPITGTIGKSLDLKREAIFLKEIEKLDSAEVKSVTFGGTEDNIAMTEWAIGITNRRGETKTVYRVNVQHWKDNKIINERLYFCGDDDF